MIVNKIFLVGHFSKTQFLELLLFQSHLIIIDWSDQIHKIRIFQNISILEFIKRITYDFVEKVLVSFHHVWHHLFSCYCISPRPNFSIVPEDILPDSLLLSSPEYIYNTHMLYDCLIHIAHFVIDNSHSITTITIIVCQQVVVNTINVTVAPWYSIENNFGVDDIVYILCYFLYKKRFTQL